MDILEYGPVMEALIPKKFREADERRLKATVCPTIP